jgi:transposase
VLSSNDTMNGRRGNRFRFQRPSFRTDGYRRRFIVERTFAWIMSYRRIVVRYDNHIGMFIAFFQLACVMITLRKCL